MAINPIRHITRLHRLFSQCTFAPALGPARRIRDSSTPVAHCTTVTPLHRLPIASATSPATFSPRHQAQHRCYASKSTSSPSTAAKATTANGNNSGTQWTRDDDKMLAILRRTETDLGQIQSYMPHQPIAAIEARVRQLDEMAALKPTFQRWTPKEDELLAKAVRELGVGNWSEISEIYFSLSDPIERPSEQQEKSATMTGRRSPRSCQIRWNFLHPDSSSHAYRTGPWSPEEIELFQELVDPSPSPGAPNDWDEISRAIGTRSAIQCHSQFKTVMHSGTKGKWTVEEVNRLLEARELYGGDWQKVAKHVGTRAAGQVRQKWNQFSEDVLRRLQERRLRDRK